MNKIYIFLLAVITVLLASNIFTGVFLFGKKNTQEKFKQQYPYLNPGRGIYDPKDLIVNMQPLRDQLAELENNADVSVYFEFLNTGANITINKDIEIWPASLMKIPVAMAAMKKVENGLWSMDKEFLLEEQDKNPVFGTLYQKPIGTKLTLKELLDELLINSDNTARNILTANLTVDDLGDVLNHTGVEFDYLNDGQITAKRYSIFWRSLFSSSYLSLDDSQKLIEIMSRSSAITYLASGLPNDVKVSHKIGILYDKNIYADSGIVYIPNRPYILTVMVKNHSQAQAEQVMKDISQKAYKYIFDYK